MPQTYKAVISDTSCFITLDKIEALTILQKLFDEIITSVKVANEFCKALPDWVKIVEVKNQKLFNELLLEVDNGEASAIALPSELQPSLLIIDDLKGRRLAKELHLNYPGTLGGISQSKTKRISLFSQTIF